MLPKNFILRAPVDSQVVSLEQFLTFVGKNATQSFSGEYIGTGLAQTIDTPFTPSIIIISPKVDYGRMTAATLAGEFVFTLMGNSRTSWIPSLGFVKDAVTDIQYKKFSIGTRDKINTLNQTYLYFIMG